MPSLKEHFPLLKKRPIAYLDSAATTQKPACVIEAMNSFYLNHYGTVHRAVYALAEEATLLYEEARNTVASFLSVKRNEVIFTRGTTESFNFLAYSLTKQFTSPGDEILITTSAHHANIVPWQMAAEERGLILKVAEESALEEMLTPRTKIVSLTHASNVLGVVNPLKEQLLKAKSIGAITVVDGAQAAPHLPLNLSALQPDFYLFSGHKIYGPTGIGVLFGKESLLNALPPPQGGGDMIEEVTYEKSRYKEAPLRFEAGTPPIAEAIGLKAAIDFFMQHQKSAFSEEKRLFSLLREKLLEFPEVTLFGDEGEKVPLATFTVQGKHPLDIATLLSLKNVYIRSGHLCAQPLLRKLGLQTALRASIGLYTTEEDIELFSTSLKEAIQKL